MWSRRDGNENAKNNGRLRKKNINDASASHFFVHFFAFFTRPRREIAKF